MSMYLIDDDFLLVDTAGIGEPVYDEPGRRLTQKLIDSIMAESLHETTTVNVQIFNRIVLND